MHYLLSVSLNSAPRFLEVTILNLNPVPLTKPNNILSCRSVSNDGTYNQKSEEDSRQHQQPSCARHEIRERVKTLTCPCDSHSGIQVDPQVPSVWQSQAGHNRWKHAASEEERA
ncbi:MAG: hypothetical protein Q9170_006954 [Blastenia crenularia]